MKSKRKLIVTMGLFVMVAIGGAFAYFSQTLTVDNPFNTGKYDSVLVEDFNPADGENWEPGSTVNKDVEIENTGNYDVLVRVRFDETWTGINDDRVKRNEGMDKTVGQIDATDGIIGDDNSVVDKTLNDNNWAYNGDDGYWYYKSQLAPGETTGVFLDAVKLLEDTDMGKYVEKFYYTEAIVRPNTTEIGTNPTTQWVAYDKTRGIPGTSKHTMSLIEYEKDVNDKELKGYSDANYVLTITAQTVQATEAAVKSVFKITTLPGCNWSLSE